MRTLVIFITAICCSSFSAAQTAPSFAKDIAPLLAARCAGCHATTLKMGGLDTDSHDSLLRGGAHGTVVVPGNSAESRLYLMLTGKVAPLMPMDGGLAESQIDMVKRWIDAGARGPTPEEAVELQRKQTQAKAPPQVKPRVPVKPQVFAIAWHPRGDMLALAGYREVKLVEPRTNRSVALLPGHIEAVRSLAFSQDGNWLVTGGGVPGRRGEIKIWDVAQKTERLHFEGHDDCVYAVAFSPDGRMIATASYDKLIKLWDASTGKEIRTLKDHIDAVYALAFTPDGKRLVSGSADRTVKVWDPSTGVRLFTLSEAQEGINTVAVDPLGKRIAAGGIDKSIRVWSIGETGGELLQSLMAHEDGILKIAWSPDGRTLVSSAADRTIKVLTAADLTELRSLGGQAEWAYGVAFSPDGKFLAVGRLDGSLSLYDSTQYKDARETRRADAR
jgi:dipeptidyl aminopeptidase/acylaminoacyl peptidase